MMGRLKKLAAVLLSGVIWISAPTNASAATIDLNARGLVANQMAFFTETGTGASTFFDLLYTYIGSSPDLGVVIASNPGTGDTDFSLGLNGGPSSSLSATSEVVMDSATSIDILFSIDIDTLGISGSHILASITHTDPLLFGASIFSQDTVDVGASISLTSVSAIPLPASIVLLLTALGGLALVHRRTA